jgi:hypothetical protein
MPVRQRQAQALKIRMPIAQQCLDVRDLAVAARDSRHLLQSFAGNLIEGPTIANEHGLLPRVPLPTAHH